MTRTREASYLAGEKGRNRVRLFAHPTSGMLYLEWKENGEKTRRSLAHSDWAVGKVDADEWASELARGARTMKPKTVTLGELFDIYEREVTAEKAERTGEHDTLAMRLFREAWGSSFAIAALGQLEWGRFIRARRAGRLAGLGPVRDRVIEHDLRFMVAVCNWAVKAKLLASNPALGLEIPKEHNPRQPLLTPADYVKLQSAAAEVSLAFHLALTLAWETGRRIGSIRHLRWSDVDLQRKTLRFLGAYDKGRRTFARDVEIALSPAACAAIAAAAKERVAAGTIGDGWIFASPRNGKPLARDYFRKCWTAAEDLAKLPHVEGGGFHSCRRAFATDHLDRGTPDETVNAIAGWAKGSSVARTTYYQPRLEQQRAALTARGA